MAFDIEQPEVLPAYLRRTGRITATETVTTRILPGGVSNRTVLVQRPTGEAWVVKQALPKLRVATDWFSDPARIHREALGLRWLEKFAPITPLVFEDEANHLLAMQAVPEPHANWKTLLLTGRIEVDHFRQFGRILGSIHTAHIPAEVFADRSYFESLRVEPYYAYSAAQVPAAAGFLHALIADVRRQALVHGDYSPKNILIHEGRLILLDHEVIHWGDPAFDLGFSLTHFLSKAHHLPPHRAAFVDAINIYWTSYRELASPDEPHVVRHTLGCLLARVAGRSPLEYLSATERDRQRRAVLALIPKPPSTIHALVKEFLACL